MKCISDVPGLAKQTFTPLATSVRSSASAPFMPSSEEMADMRGEMALAEGRMRAISFIATP